MFASMASRLPDGGILSRYRQVVTEVARSLARETSHANFLQSSDSEWPAFAEEAEERLTIYPLHLRVKGFFDEFVGNYGHSSIQEQVGDPALYVEGISWLTAWLLFDSPLVKGQEFSTRAVRYKDWSMAREVGGHDGLAALHRDWLEVYDTEVEWWKNHLTDPANREALGIGDNEPFRPALDRARWALPGSIATGACFTSDLRERARVLLAGKHLCRPAQPVWTDLADAYCRAQPGIALHALRKMYTDDEVQVPAHLKRILTSPPYDLMEDGKIVDLCIEGHLTNDLVFFDVPYDTPAGQYADPWTNRTLRFTFSLECSLAVARDWHRHRTMYPWGLFVALDLTGFLQCAQGYEPMSDYAKQMTPELWRRSSALYFEFLRAGDIQRAALALPFGTRMSLTGTGGYRDVKYMLELRANARGANFEYKAQAQRALDDLQKLITSAVEW
jgi:hypothetical protein